jgi:hypothetical protein
MRKYGEFLAPTRFMRIFTAINVSKEHKLYITGGGGGKLVLTEKRRLLFASNAGLLLDNEQAV